MNNERTATADRTAAGRALLLRDQALATLDEGDPAAPLVINQALAVLEAAGLSSGPDMAAVLVTRAEIEESADRFGDAAATASLAIRLLDGSTAGHPDAARDWNALGALYHGAGRLGDAAEAYRRALAVFEHRFGPEHFEVGMTCANLAVLASDEGRCEEAESLGRRSARILEAVLGPEDAEVGLTLLNLAACIAQQGRQAEAAALASRSAAILAARLPAGHPYVAAAAEAVRAWEPPA